MLPYRDFGIRQSFNHHKTIISRGIVSRYVTYQSSCSTGYVSRDFGHENTRCSALLCVLLVLTGIVGEGIARAIPVVKLRLGETYGCTALPFRYCAMDYGFALVVRFS